MFSIYHTSDRGNHADEAVVWDDPPQGTYPTVHPTAHSESDVNCNAPTTFSVAISVSNTIVINTASSHSRQ